MDLRTKELSSSRDSSNGSNMIGARLLQFTGAWSFLPPRMACFVRRGYHWEWKEKPPRLRIPSLLEQSGRVQKLLDLREV